MHVGAVRKAVHMPLVERHVCVEPLYRDDERVVLCAQVIPDAASDGHGVAHGAGNTQRGHRLLFLLQNSTAAPIS